MGGFESHPGGKAGVVGFHPTGQAQTPEIARFQSGEMKPRLRGGEIVPTPLAELQKFLGYLDADGMHAGIIGTGIAFPVTEESGQGRCAARNQSVSIYIFGHVLRIVKSWTVSTMAMPLPETGYWMLDAGKHHFSIRISIEMADILLVRHRTQTGGMSALPSQHLSNSGSLFNSTTLQSFFDHDQDHDQDQD